MCIRDRDSLTAILWFKKPQGERKTPLQQMLERLNQAFAQNGKIYLLHLPTAPLDIMASIHFYNDMVRECKDCLLYTSPHSRKDGEDHGEGTTAKAG